MPEKKSSIERVVGKMPEEGRERILRDTEERFSDQNFEDLRGLEREKSLEEMEIISLVNDETNKLLVKYDLPEFNIPAENIHIIERAKWWYGNCDAYFNSLHQALYICDLGSKMVFADALYHELTHIKSYGALQIQEGGEKPTYYRTGLLIKSRFSKDENEYLEERLAKLGRRYIPRYFNNLNEAVTEELTKRFIFGPAVAAHPLFSEEREETLKLKSDFLKMAREDEENPFLGEDEDIFCVKAVGGKEAFRGWQVVYPQERRIFNTLIDRLFAKNEGRFKDREEVFDVFAKAMFSGNILPLGRLIDGSFGPGTFRKIGELDEKVDEQESFVNAL